MTDCDIPAVDSTEVQKRRERARKDYMETGPGGGHEEKEGNFCKGEVLIVSGREQELGGLCSSGHLIGSRAPSRQSARAS